MSKPKRALFIIVTVVLLAVSAEVSLQVIYRLSVGTWIWEWWALPIFEEDPVRGYRVKSNLDYLHKTSEFTARYLTDQLGMRTDSGKQQGPVIPKPDGTFRILALGPSFTFGWGVNYEDCYMHIIAEGLQIPGKRVELINLGTPGQLVSYQLKWLEAVGYRYQPDLIVQTVYGDMQNLDVEYTFPEDRRPRVKNGYMYPGAMTPALWARRLRTYSAALFYGWHAYHAVRALGTGSGDGRESHPPSGLESGGSDEAVRRYRRYVDFVHGAVTTKPDVVFLFVPKAHVVRPSDVTRVAHHGSVENPWEVRGNATLLTEALRSNHVQMVNTTEVLVENDRVTRMYNLYDIHFTAAGNKVVADYSLPVIQEALRRDLSNCR